MQILSRKFSFSSLRILYENFLPREFGAMRYLVEGKQGIDNLQPSMLLPYMLLGYNATI